MSKYNSELLLSSGRLDADVHSDTLKLHQNAYGPYYRPRAVAKFIENATDIVGLRHECGSLAGAAILHESRIVSFATTTDRNLGKRSDIGIKLAEEAQGTGAEWATIGSIHRVIRLAAAYAGLQRVTDEQAITTYLDSVELKDAYAITGDEADLPVITSHISVEEDRPYPQQVWAWPAV